MTGFATEFPGMSAHVGGLADDQSPVAGGLRSDEGPFLPGYGTGRNARGRARRDVSATQALAPDQLPAEGPGHRPDRQALPRRGT